MSDDYDDYEDQYYDDAQQYEEEQARAEELAEKEADDNFLIFGIVSGFFDWLFKQYPTSDTKEENMNTEQVWNEIKNMKGLVLHTQDRPNPFEIIYLF